MNIDYLYQDWKYWMLELLSISCLSVAIKFNEKSPLSLHEIQVINLSLHQSFYVLTEKEIHFQYTKLREGFSFFASFFFMLLL